MNGPLTARMLLGDDDAAQLAQQALRATQDANTATRAAETTLERALASIATSLAVLAQVCVLDAVELPDVAAEGKGKTVSAQVEAVRALHKAGRWYLDECDHPECEVESVELSAGELYHADAYELVCETCTGDLDGADDPVPWPCPTIRALDGADR